MSSASTTASPRKRRRKIPQGPAKPFAVQLVDVQVQEISTKRRRHRASDGDKPQVDAWLTPLDASETLPGFAVIAGADVTCPIDGRNTAAVRLSVLGIFEALEDVRPELLERFQHADAMVLLWPYVRTHVGSVTKMMNIIMAPLPTLDVQQMIQPVHSHDPAD
jgi:preprotein translocase subunit SecB